MAAKAIAEKTRFLLEDTSRLSAGVALIAFQSLISLNPSKKAFNPSLRTADKESSLSNSNQSNEPQTPQSTQINSTDIADSSGLNLSKVNVEPMVESIVETTKSTTEDQKIDTTDGRDSKASDFDSLSHADQELGDRTPGAEFKPRERSVPSTQIGRMLGFAGLGASLAVGTFQESARRLWNGPAEDSGMLYGPFLTERNAERLALSLCRMRGAALKLGQMISIQDEQIVPPQVLAALERVRQGADVMPKRQLEKVLEAELGASWRSKIASFDFVPIAAASIGQVHRAVLLDGREVAMKVQYPGVADSIDSDIDNLKRLLSFTTLVPKQMYLDQAIKVAKVELARECDYRQEAISQKRFRDLMIGRKGFNVPAVVDELSGHRVLTTELVPGVSIDRVAGMSQQVRNDVGTRLLQLTLMELFEFRFMQTDPNWGNFLYDRDSDTIQLIDFGAAREFPKAFVDDYLKMVRACADKDREGVIAMSTNLGFLTGDESRVLLDAHTQAGFIVGLPFAKLGGYDFAKGSLTKRVTDLGGTMVRHRLTPPPEDAYSLHRKLSGSFLACIKLQAVVPCREMFLKVFDQYTFEEKFIEVGEKVTS